jgi:hypothetical protein
VADEVGSAAAIGSPASTGVGVAALACSFAGGNRLRALGAAVSVDHTAIQRLGFEVGKELHLEAPVN